MHQQLAAGIARCIGFGIANDGAIGLSDEYHRQFWKGNNDIAHAPAHRVAISG
jgi:hypothetical protein